MYFFTLYVYSEQLKLSGLCLESAFGSVAKELKCDPIEAGIHPCEVFEYLGPHMQLEKFPPLFS